MQPSKLNYVLAYAAEISAWLGALGGIVLLVVILNNSDALILDSTVILWSAVAAVPMGALGWLFGRVIMWMLLGHAAARIQGWPFQVGEEVWILRGKHRNRIARIYEVWAERGQVRIDIGDDAKNSAEDVIVAVAVCRMKTQYGMPRSASNRLTNPSPKPPAMTQEQSAISGKKCMKTPTRSKSDFKGYERVSMFFYVWYLALAHLIFLAIVGFSVYMFAPVAEERSRITLTFAALFVTGTCMSIVQHNILTFRCRRCGCKMTKYRDSDTHYVAFYYVCDKCRIYWRNKATGH